MAGRGAVTCSTHLYAGHSQPQHILFSLNKSTFYLHMEGGVCLDNRGLGTKIICAGFVGLTPRSPLSLPGMT